MESFLKICFCFCCKIDVLWPVPSLQNRGDIFVSHQYYTEVCLEGTIKFPFYCKWHIVIGEIYGFVSGVNVSTEKIVC
jgi:hypothetical protein